MNKQGGDWDAGESAEMGQRIRNSCAAPSYSLGDSLNAEVVNGQIIQTPQFRHRSLKERAAAYQLPISMEKMT